ncbi:Gldg family protein [Pedobacter hiemivivus]|uniref:ABC-type uncharacterized transport system domain-containing protein n=1 Tax=Pedobacter hiemivivus TaxID=2530454 RepID=A0A4R0NGE4_9SPHI|nr:Gldg family protein [Pedobacter hiemivivus]TCC99505.1 hypothetical protein EZ444_02185 [Pedobacter hiemivivus]
MKIILKIAGHELKLLFFSPIAWLLLIVFLYQFGAAFAGHLSGADGGVLKYFPGYTSWLFSGNLLPDVEGKIYLYIPLMTMGIMSQELNSGNIKLLFSSPIKNSSIVLGKYLGTMGYWVIVIGLFSLFAIPPYFMISSLDLGIVLPGILAIFLLACTYSAIGLFMSCLTTYQVVAALSTLTTLAALNYIGGLWQGIPVLKDIVNFLHIAGHAQNMNWGFIKSKDILYFVIISSLFLGLAIFYVEDTIKARTKVAKINRYALFTAAMVFLGCMVSLRQFTLYFDTTAIKFNTISTSSQELLKKIKGPVSVTAYSNLLDDKNEINVGRPENRVKDFNFWEPYIRFLPQLELNYVNYYSDSEHYKSGSALDSAARQRAEARGWYIEDYLSPKELSKTIDLKSEDFTFVRCISHGNKHRFLRVFKDFIHKPSEKEIITAFTGLLVDYTRIGFLTGHYERTIEENEDRGYKKILNEKPFRSSLLNNGFEFQLVSIKGNIPGGIDALVIADPLSAFSSQEQQKIKDYISKGGNLLVTGGPGSQEILNPIISHVGVRLLEGQLVQRNKDFTPAMVFTHCPLREGGDPYEFQTPGVLGMPEAVALEYKTNAGFKVEEAVVTDESNTWKQNREIPSDTSLITYQPEFGDIHGQLPVAVSLTRNIDKKQQRIMIVGNGNFFSNVNLERDYTLVPASHLAFGVAIFKWLGYGQYPVTVKPLERSKDVELLYTKESFEKYRPYYIWLLPSLVFLFGAIFLLRRRRK